MKKILLFSLLLLTKIVFAQVPANDVCTNAIVLTTSTSCVNSTGKFNSATNSGVSNSCGGFYDVFYKFVADASTATVTAVPGSGVDVVLSVMASCSSTTSLACVDNPSSGSATEIAYLTGLTAGTTYYIKVQNFNSTLPTTATFSICVVSTAAVPSNDVCANAISLTPSTTCTSTAGTLLSATTSTLVPTCQSSYNSDVFYKFVANAVSTSITVTASSGLDPVIAVYSSCGGGSVGCVDNGATGASETLSLTGLTIGQTYFIQVSDYSGVAPTTPTFSICIVSIPNPPINDLCTNAISLTPSTACTPTSGTLLNATTSTLVPTCRSSYNSDVFYKFVANATIASVTVAATSGMDPILAVYSSCGGNSVGCMDDGATGDNETLDLTGLTIGTTYFIQVSDFNTSLPTTFVFSICVVSTPTLPGNDLCANATSLTPSTTCTPTSGTLLNATTSTSAPTCRSSYNSDVFYKFVANAATTSITVTPSSGMDPILAVYSSCGGGSVGCIDNGSAGENETLNLTGLTIGTTYFIQVSDFSSTLPETPTFSICVYSTASAPDNDLCANAISLTPATTCTPTSGTLLNATTSTLVPGCRSSYNSDVFYEFVATANAASIIVTPTAGIDPILAVYSSCGGTSVGCVDNGEIGIPETLDLTGLTIGTTYFIQVSDYYTSLPTTFTFSICVKSNVTTATQSSNALRAISLYPNPTQSVLNIENVSMNTKIELIDLSGKTILVQDLSADSQIDLSNYSAGVYILKLTLDGASENRRVVLSK